MTMWVVITYWNLQESRERQQHICGVFSTEALAQAWIDEADHEFFDFDIWSYQLDHGEQPTLS